MIKIKHRSIIQIEVIYILTAICILDPSKTKHGFESDDEVFNYIYSHICKSCKDNIKHKTLQYLLDTPCCFGFWWVEDDDDV